MKVLDTKRPGPETSKKRCPKSSIHSVAVLELVVVSFIFNILQYNTYCMLAYI